MTLTLTLRPATLQKLERAAKAEGVTLETYAAGILQKSAALTTRSFREIFAPFHAATKASGMSGAEVDQLIDETVAEYRAQHMPRQ